MTLSIMPRDEYLIAMAFRLAEKGLDSLCEHVRDLLITYYVKETGRVPGQVGRIVSCYFEHMRAIEQEWNKRHLAVISQAKRDFKEKNGALKQRAPDSYWQLKLRYVHAIEKKCLLAELSERFGKVFFGPVRLREYTQIENCWKRTFTTDRWLQVLVNQTQSTDREKNQILETTEDYDLFRVAAFPPDSAESAYLRTLKKSPFQFFAERAILHFQSGVTRVPCSDEQKQASIISALLRTYVAFQTARNGPIERFVQLLPRENLGRSRMDSSRIIVGVQEAPARIAFYTQRIEEVLTEALPIQLPPTVTCVTEELKKSTNQFYITVSDAAANLTAFLSLLPSCETVSSYTSSYEAANSVLLKIDAIRQKEMAAGGFPLNPREKRLTLITEEPLLPQTAFLISLVQNSGAIDFITSFKNLIYSFSAERSPVERNFAKNLYVQPLNETELANNRNYEKRLTEVREKYEAEYKNDPLQNKLTLSKVLAEEDTIVFAEAQEIHAKQEQDRHELENRRKAVKVAPPSEGLGQIYGSLQLKIDPETYTKRRWLQLFLNRETHNDEEWQSTRELIESADDRALMIENFSLQGSHTPLGKFAACVFECVALKARRILDEYAAKPLPVKKTSLLTKLTRSFSKLSMEQDTIVSHFPETSRLEYVQTIITDAQLTCLASLQYIRQELLKMRRNAFDFSLDCSVDTVSHVSSKEAVEDYQAIQESLVVLYRQSQTPQIDEAMISIVNVQKEGISRAFIDLDEALHRMIQFWHERVKLEPVASQAAASGASANAVQDYIRALEVAYTNIRMIREKIA